MLGNSNFNGRALPTVSNPLSYNYPKISNFKGSQYSTYPKFKQENLNGNQNDVKQNYNENLNKQLSAKLTSPEILALDKDNLSEKTKELKNKLMTELEQLEKITEKAKKIIGTNNLKSNNITSTNNSSISDKNEKNTNNGDAKNINDMNKLNNSSNNGDNSVNSNIKNDLNANNNVQNLESKNSENKDNKEKNMEIDKIKFNLSKEERNRFNNKMKEIMNKLSKIK